MKVFFTAAAFAAALLMTCCSSDGQQKLITGSYSDTGEGGINVFSFNTENGSLSATATFNAGKNPSYICFGKGTDLVYAINEVDSFDSSPHSGGLTTLKHNGSFGSFSKVGEMAIPNGGPCHITLSPGNKFLLVANYGGGSVAVVKLGNNGIPEKVTDTIVFKGNNGSVSHAHMSGFDPQGERVYVSDLGLDRIWIFTLDSQTGRLRPFITDGIKLPEGTGPRHFVFNESGSVMYVIGELNSTMTVLKRDNEKGLVAVQTISTLKEGDTVKNACADIHIGKSGTFLYGSNRGDNSIVVYSIRNDGSLQLTGQTGCGGNWPRNFTIDPSGKFMLVGNQKSNNIAVFKIDEKNGMPAVKVNDLKLHSPVCLKFN
ncbi:MAG TPA: lactonase family protein [Bacteroidales bacterium]|nr:lactonase family protein [Bacteroidales bacterium]